MRAGIKFDEQSLALHSDRAMAVCPDVVPPITVSTTYRYDDDPDSLVPEHKQEDGAYSNDYYSRMGTQVTRRVEQVLKSILKGECVLYGSGLSAFHAAMLHYNPKQVFTGDVYHGCVGILEIMTRNFGTRVHSMDESVIRENIQPGDVIHLETPANPYGTVHDIAHYAQLAKQYKAHLLVDSTFAPPPASQPLDFGADMVMHSATKYLGGHSDLLAGVLVVRTEQQKKQLWHDRSMLGSGAGSMESWLLLRSLRTFSMRLNTQMSNVAKVVEYLSENGENLPKLAKVYHCSLQQEEFIAKQMPLGGGPVFSIETTDMESAKTLPSKLSLFHHATSLGGVESLIEWRQMSDSRVSDRLLRVSIGCENAQDLIDDLKQALQ